MGKQKTIFHIEKLASLVKDEHFIEHEQNRIKAQKSRAFSITKALKKHRENDK